MEIKGTIKLEFTLLTDANASDREIHEYLSNYLNIGFMGLNNPIYEDDDAEVDLYNQEIEITES